jgi:transcriptional regulator with XRE-family HTH domain
MNVNPPRGSAGELGDPAVVRIMLGSHLRRFRDAAGVTAEQAAHEIRASRSKISRLENGRVGFKARDVADLLTLYGVTDEQDRARMLSYARQANTPDWWSRYGDIVPDWSREYLSLERAASVIRSFELQFVHGLLQTAAYAQAVTMLAHQGAAGAEIERRVSMRLNRQDVLYEPDPPRVWAVMDEAVLRRPVGGTAVMRAQLEHLAEVAALPHVTVQVVPFGRGGHAAAGGSFTILRFAEEEVPDVVYIEQLTSALYLEGRQDVEHYLQVMHDLSVQALTPSRTARFLTEIIHERG